VKIKLVGQDGQLLADLLKLPFGNGSPHKASSCGEIKLVSAQVSAADGNPQFRITGLVDPADGRCITTAFEWFQCLQPMHRLPPRQARYRWSGVECGGEGKGLMPCGIGTNRGMKVDQMPMSCQLGTPRPLGGESLFAKAVADRLDH
jgi:hypothetical protein